MKKTAWARLYWSNLKYYLTHPLVALRIRKDTAWCPTGHCDCKSCDYASFGCGYYD